MKKDAILVNTSRGPVIDESALVEHCRSHPDFRVGLDVFEDEPELKPGLGDLENVVKVYPDGTKAVDDISLEVAEGEICVFLGPSGCGKTTTMKMINRLVSITSGRIFINGEDNLKINASELRRNIGYAIQEIGLFTHMTVGQNIETVPVLKGWTREKRRQRVEELMELVRLIRAVLSPSVIVRVSL